MDLKDFINKHREEFDDREPSEKVWRGIERAITRRNFFTAVSIWRAAAILFFGLSLYLFIAPKREVREVSNLQREFRDLESFYSEQIAEKVEFIDKLEGYEDDQFSQDLKKLDAMYEVLREEMKTSPSSKVKDALILNMLIRIDLLNQQIQKLEDHLRSGETNKEI